MALYPNMLGRCIGRMLGTWDLLASSELTWRASWKITLKKGYDMGVKPKRLENPQIIHFDRVWNHEINKPSILGGFHPIFGNIHIYILKRLEFFIVMLVFWGVTYVSVLGHRQKSPCWLFVGFFSNLQIIYFHLAIA